jgi:hypothetical protein
MKPRELRGFIGTMMSFHQLITGSVVSGGFWARFRARVQILMQV